MHIEYKQNIMRASHHKEREKFKTARKFSTIITLKYKHGIGIKGLYEEGKMEYDPSFIFLIQLNLNASFFQENINRFLINSIIILIFIIFISMFYHTINIFLHYLKIHQ